MFVYKDRGKISYIETIFNDYNFLHLTGIKYNKNAVKFFGDCLNHKLSPNNIQIKSLVFTKLKLEVLENIMFINKSAKKIGTYNNNKENIKIEKVVGNIHCCLGFSNRVENNRKIKYYYPKTLLQENFKNNVEHEYKIIAIFCKDKIERLYSEFTYLSKEFKERDIKQILTNFCNIDLNL